ncbi:hypothetical protein GCM10027024_27780 [Microbacterium insulae]
MEAAFIAFATTAATLAVTIWLALLEFRRRRREAAELRRAQIVSRVLDTLERGTRAASRAPVASWWSPNELEYALLLPRLLAELPQEDSVVATWVARRLQHLRNALSRRAQVVIGADIASHVVQWGRRELDNEWFAGQLQADPWIPGLKPSRRSRWVRHFRDGLQLAPITAVMTLTVLATRDAAVWLKPRTTHDSRRKTG